MTFEGQYLTYAEYLTLGGSAIGEMPFNLLEFEARRQIDLRAFDRIKDLDHVPQIVKLCDFHLINSIKKTADANSNVASSGNIKSENIDGYSVSYLSAADISSIVKSMDDEIDFIIRTYLLGVKVNEEHILYCGID